MTGRTYHAVNTAPYPLPEHKTRTVLRTQSHKAEGFNELCFEDEAGEEQIWLHAQKDLKLLTLNDRTEEIQNDSHLKVHNDRISGIDNGDHLTVNGTRHGNIGQAQLVGAGQEIHHKACLRMARTWLSVTRDFFMENSLRSFYRDFLLIAASDFRRDYNRYARMRGLERVKEQCLLAAACQNLKKIAQARWRWLFYVT